MYVVRNLLRNVIIFAKNVCNQSEGKYTYGDAIHALRDYIRGKPQFSLFFYFNLLFAVVIDFTSKNRIVEHFLFSELNIISSI